jgi:hypothetical protein
MTRLWRGYNGLAAFFFFSLGFYHHVLIFFTNYDAHLMMFEYNINFCGIIDILVNNVHQWS